MRVSESSEGEETGRDAGRGDCRVVGVSARLLLFRVAGTDCCLAVFDSTVFTTREALEDAAGLPGTALASAGWL